jgi:hypothetical protein
MSVLSPAEHDKADIRHAGMDSRHLGQLAGLVTSSRDNHFL